MIHAFFVILLPWIVNHVRTFLVFSTSILIMSALLLVLIHIGDILAEIPVSLVNHNVLYALEIQQINVTLVPSIITLIIIFNLVRPIVFLFVLTDSMRLYLIIHVNCVI